MLAGIVNFHISIADIIQSALDRMPKRGNITGSDLILLQGLVCLLKDSHALILHAQKVIEGNSTGSVLDALLKKDESVQPDEDNPFGTAELPVLPEVVSAPVLPEIPSMGLW